MISRPYLLTAWLAAALPLAANAQAGADTIPFRAEPVPPQLRAIFQRCDSNADMQLSWQEFESCWRQMRYARQRPMTPATTAPAEGAVPPAAAAPQPPTAPLSNERNDATRDKP